MKIIYYKNTILITTNQLLSVKHAPSEIVLDTMRILDTLEFQVHLLVNYTYFSSEQLTQLLCSCRTIRATDDLYGKGILKYDTLMIPYMQVNYARNTQQAIRDVRVYIEEIKPEFVWHIGGTSFISDMVGRCSTMIATKCTDGYAVSKAPILASFSVGKSSYSKESQKIIERNGQEFLQWIKEIVDYSDNICFVTVGEKICLDKYPYLIDRIIQLGYQDNLNAVLNCMNIYVNPPRQGGGGSAICAMAAGIPVITLGGCDVANAVPEEYIVLDLKAMHDTVIKCVEDREYYAFMCQKAAEKNDEIEKAYENGEVQESINNVLEIARMYEIKGRDII